MAIDSQEKRIVLSVGGNALTMGKGKETVEDQRAACRIACQIIAKVYAKNPGMKLVVTHGNGPQFGFIDDKFSCANAHGVSHPVPADAINADTQGAIGYMIEQELYNALQSMPEVTPERAENITTLVTQILVDRDDPAFNNPTKPIGSWMTQQEAENVRDEKGWAIKNKNTAVEAGWRRVVPSPKPVGVFNAQAIRRNFEANSITVCGGGGGIPVVREGNGKLVGVEGVIDKDLTTALIAEVVQARLMAILTKAPGIIDPSQFKEKKDGTMDGQVIPVMTTKTLRDMLPSLQEGSMKPKAEACLLFTERTGDTSLIANFDNGLQAIQEGVGGTRIVPSPGTDEV